MSKVECNIIQVDSKTIKLVPISLLLKDTDYTVILTDSIKSENKSKLVNFLSDFKTQTPISIGCLAIDGFLFPVEPVLSGCLAIDEFEIVPPDAPTITKVGETIVIT